MARLIARLQETRYALFRGEAPKLSYTAIAVLAGGQPLDGSKAKVELDYSPELSMRDAIDRAFIWFEKHGYIRK